MVASHGIELKARLGRHRFPEGGELKPPVTIWDPDQAMST
jgi:hypothetical protein